MPMASSTMTSSTKDTAEHTAEPAAEHTVDIHTTAGKLADLRKRVEETLRPVDEAAVERSMPTAS
jgi:propionyl-CoA carboxylase beta chain